MTQTELLQHIKERLQGLYGSRFRGLVLFGSVARGDADEDSDIDLLCLLEGPVDTITEIKPLIKAVTDIQRESGEMLSIIAVDATDFDDGAYPLMIEAKREGVAV